MQRLFVNAFSGSTTFNGSLSYILYDWYWANFMQALQQIINCTEEKKIYVLFDFTNPSPLPLRTFAKSIIQPTINLYLKRMQRYCSMLLAKRGKVLGLQLASYIELTARPRWTRQAGREVPKLFSELVPYWTHTKKKDFLRFFFK